MTDPTPDEARAICITCNLTGLSNCLHCAYRADFPEKDFNPSTMTRATPADIERIYQELWNKPLKEG